MECVVSRMKMPHVRECAISVFYIVGSLIFCQLFFFQDRTFKATHQFKNFTYWNLETAMCVNDAIVKAMVWPQIAQAVSFL